MPLNLASLIQDRATAKIALGPGTLEVEYYPARLTAQMLLDIADIAHVDDLPESRRLAIVTNPTQTLLTLLAQWDLVETNPATGADQPVPLDEPHIASLGVAIQWAMLRGLVYTQNQAAAGEASAPEASANAQPSGATSSPEAH